MNAEEYISALAPEREKAIRKVREVIISTIVDINETMAYKMPTFGYDQKKLFALASQKHYMSLYVMPYDLLDNFKEELSVLNCGKSCVRFKKLDAATLALLEKIIVYCYRNHSTSKFYEKY